MFAKFAAMKRLLLLHISLILWAVHSVSAQELSFQNLINKGDSLRKNYQFEEAKQLYQHALEQVSDSLLLIDTELKILQCENGNSLLQYAVQPEILGRTLVEKPQAWRYIEPVGTTAFWSLPGTDSLPTVPNYPIFVSPETMIFTGRASAEGTLDLYISQKLNDTLWSYPQIMDSGINSPGNECYPVLSADGKSLFFASDGHYGMGGYDLYVSYYDDDSQSWSPAQNMGFPFSSPENDWAFGLSPDGNAALFLSDRGAAADKLWLYKVAYEMHPLRRDIRNQNNIALLAQLDPGSKGLEEAPKPHTESGQEAHTQEALADYSALAQQARKAREVVAEQEKNIARSRELYTQLSQEEEKRTLGKKIADEEVILIELQEQLRRAGQALQAAETAFLKDGILPPLLPKENPQNNSHEIVKQVFTPRMAILQPLQASFAPPIFVEPPVNLAFREETVSEIIPEENPPLHLFYRIQMAVSTTPSKASAFKGFSPIFEQKLKSGRYLYAAGQFDRYDDAAKALAQVQRKGLKNTLLIAYNEGKSLSVTLARTKEQAGPQVVYRVSLGFHPQGVPEALLEAVRGLSPKDVARVVSDEGIKYVVGPFASQQEAQQLQSALQQKGFVTEIEKI